MKSFVYSQISSVDIKKGAHASQFLITYEGQPSKNPEEKIIPRLTAIVELSDESDFVRFDVSMNEIPVGHFVGNRDKSEYMAETAYQRGKDVVIDWEFLDNFDTDSNLWIDANGLDMHRKRLWERTEFKYNKSDNIAANFYPV